MKITKMLPGIIFLMIGIGILSMAAFVMAHGVDLRAYRDDERPDKTGVLVISIVPRDVPTAAKLKLMDETIKEIFPDFVVRWSFFNIGSEPVDLFKTEGDPMSPRKMLNQMEEEDFTHVAILPLSIVPSETYTRLVWMVDTLRKTPTKFRKISLAKPFFGAPKKIRQTCQTVLNILPSHADKGEAVVLFFEEQSILGDYIYPGIQYYFWQLDTTVFIGTAGTTPAKKDVVNSLENNNSTEVYLVPFLPYQTPLLTDWKTTLEDSGYRVKQIITPLVGQYQVIDVMISRLRDAIDKLGL